MCTTIQTFHESLGEGFLINLFDYFELLGISISELLDSLRTII